MTSPSKKITVLLADDHFMVRLGLAASINRETDIDVIAEAESAAEASQLGSEKKPDVAIIDMHLGDGDGIGVIEHLSEHSPQTRCLILSVSTSENHVLRAHAAGARGYLAKSSDREEIIDAIRSLAADDTYFPSAVHRTLEAGKARIPLSQRERDVLEQLVKGLRNKEIADVLGLAEMTVKQHVSAVFKKLGVEDRTQAAMVAVERGIVDLE